MSTTLYAQQEWHRCAGDHCRRLLMNKDFCKRCERRRSSASKRADLKRQVEGDQPVSLDRFIVQEVKVEPSINHLIYRNGTPEGRVIIYAREHPRYKGMVVNLRNLYLNCHPLETNKNTYNSWHDENVEGACKALGAETIVSVYAAKTNTTLHLNRWAALPVARRIFNYLLHRKTEVHRRGATKNRWAMILFYRTALALLDKIEAAANESKTRLVKAPQFVETPARVEKLEDMWRKPLQLPAYKVQGEDAERISATRIEESSKLKLPEKPEIDSAKLDDVLAVANRAASYGASVSTLVKSLDDSLKLIKHDVKSNDDRLRDMETKLEAIQASMRKLMEAWFPAGV